MVTHGITTRNVEYNGFLKISDGTKMFLGSNRDKKILMAKLDKLAYFFQLEIIDNT